MARVPYFNEQDASPELADLFEAIRKAMGRLPNNSLLLAHTPHLLAWAIPLVLSVKSTGTGTVESELKTLIILRVSAMNGCDYCVHHNTQFADSVGANATKAEAVQFESWRERSDLFSPSEIAALAWSEHVTRNTARQAMDSFADLQAHFSTPEIVEITYIAAHRTMQNLFQEAMWNDIEGDETPKHAHMPPDFLSEYVSEVLPALVQQPVETIRNG